MQVYIAHTVFFNLKVRVKNVYEFIASQLILAPKDMPFNLFSQLVFDGQWRQQRIMIQIFMLGFKYLNIE